VIICCALAIALGTYIGGWRVIRTLGKGLVEIDSPQGMAAESGSAATILLSSHFGYSLSTTHVATGSILGSGVGRRGARVRWGVAGRMATAWVVTLPLSALVGAGTYALASVIGGLLGGIVIFVLLVAFGVTVFLKAQQTAVTPNNVNDDWPSQATPVASGR
jgi:PiT family inorganic phosphate transporter